MGLFGKSERIDETRRAWQRLLATSNPQSELTPEMAAAKADYKTAWGRMTCAEKVRDLLTR